MPNFIAILKSFCKPNRITRDIYSRYSVVCNVMSRCQVVHPYVGALPLSVLYDLIMFKKTVNISRDQKMNRFSVIHLLLVRIAGYFMRQMLIKSHFVLHCRMKYFIAILHVKQWNSHNSSPTVSCWFLIIRHVLSMKSPLWHRRSKSWVFVITTAPTFPNPVTPSPIPNQPEHRNASNYHPHDLHGQQNYLWTRRLTRIRSVMEGYEKNAGEDKGPVREPLNWKGYAGLKEWNWN